MNSQVADPIIKKKVGMEGEGGGDLLTGIGGYWRGNTKRRMLMLKSWGFISNDKLLITRWHATDQRACLSFHDLGDWGGVLGRNKMEISHNFKKKEMP